MPVLWEVRDDGSVPCRSVDTSVQFVECNVDEKPLARVLPTHLVRVNR